MSHQRTYAKAWKAGLPRTRLGWLALMVAALLLSSTAAYAVPPLLTQLFLNADAGLSQVEQLDLGQEFNLTRTTNGLTVNVQRLYADANRIVVGYTVNGRALSNNFAMSLSLVDEAGTAFQLTEERSTGVQKGTRAFIATFDAAGVRDIPGTLRLNMQPGQTPTVADPLTEGKWSALGTPISFDLRLDTKIDRRIVHLRETAQAAGITLVLEQVRISPTGVNAILCDTTSYSRGVAPHWLSAGVLATEAPGIDRVQSDASAISIEGCHTLKFPGAHYYNQSGDWTLTVTEVTAPDHQQGNDTHVTGPWTFHFTAPSK